MAAQQQRQLSSRLGQLGRTISDVQSSQEGSLAGALGYDASISNVTSTNQPSPMPEPQGVADPGHLMLGPQSKTRYMSQTHFAMISDQVAEINELLKTQQHLYVNSGEDEDESESEPEFHSGAASGSNRPNGEDRRMYGDIFPDAPAWNGQSMTVGQYVRVLSFSSLCAFAYSSWPPQICSQSRSQRAHQRTANPSSMW